MNTSRRESPSPFDRFRKDHVRVLARLTEMEAAARPERPIDEETLRRHVAALRRQFDTHMAAEEAVFYPLLARVLPTSEASLQPLHEEHADLREMLSELRAVLRRPRSSERDVQIAIQTRDLVDLLRVHIRKEESVVFDVSERVLRPGELRGLHRRLQSILPARERLGESSHEKGMRAS